MTPIEVYGAQLPLGTPLLILLVSIVHWQRIRHWEFNISSAITNNRETLFISRTHMKQEQ